MRNRLPRSAAVVALLPLLASSCNPNPFSGVTPTAQTTSCVPNEGNELVCKNLLYPDWNTISGQPNLSALQARLNEIKKDLQETGANQLRVAGAECRLSGITSQPRMVRVVYDAPKDLLRFPENGTSGRDLVVGFMESIDDKDDCWESRYGIVRKYDGWTRLFHFITANTDKASVPTPGAEDVAFGTWKSWSLYMRPNPNSPGESEYKLDTLRRGAYVRCGTPHLGPNDVAFIDCKTVHKIADSASKLVEKMTTDARSRTTGAVRSIHQVFEVLLAKYKTGDQMLLRALFSEGPSVESAWGRCGNLGCCAAE